MCGDVRVKLRFRTSPDLGIRVEEQEDGGLIASGCVVRGVIGEGGFMVEDIPEGGETTEKKEG